MADLLVLPPDAADRTRALDITHSWIVEAPAGSGKTGLLIQRYLKLLASDTVTDPRQVLAITFTRKATAELQERVLSQLTQAAAATPPANPFDRATRPLVESVLTRDRQLGWNVIENPRSLRIRTIDSVCTEIAASLPILSGAGGGQTPSDDASALHAEAARRTLMLLGGADPDLSRALELLLLHRDGSLTDSQALIASMLARRDQWGNLVPLAAQHLSEEYLEQTVLPKLERALDQAICRALTRLVQVMPASALNALCALAAEMGHLEGYEGNPSPVALCAGRPMPPAEKTAHLDHWNAIVHLLLTKDGEFRKPRGINKRNVAFLIEPPHREELSRIIAQLEGDEDTLEALCSLRSLPPEKYPPEQWHITKALFRVLARALVELQLVFAERSECDFTEVGLLAREALRRDSALDDLRTSLGVDLQHLLVDEMQDTSSAQYELIELLTRRWDGGSQTVFLVGDPKQSIYLFRQARVERFVRTQRLARLGDVPLGTLHLTANFRSRPTLVRAFNQDFSQLFPAVPDPLRPELVPFREAHPMRPLDRPAEARIWHADALPYSAVPAECTELKLAQSRVHAAELRHIAERWRALPTHKTLAVLVRNRTHLLDIVKAFKQLPDPIPYRAVDIEPLAERQEILDLLALTRALLHPADRTAWLALLRAPWCGLSLADLHTLTGQDDPAHAYTNVLDLIRTRGDLLTPDGIARLEPFWNVVSAAFARRGTLPLAPWVERTWRAFAADRVLDPESLANALRYLDLLEQLDRSGPLNLNTLAQRLRELYAASSTAPHAVDLMTIHKSKGLEWDVVFVPALERIGASNRGGLLSWLEIDPGEDPTVAHGIVAPIQPRGEASHKLNTWMRSIESAREAAERKRLLYVACTRAREELHLFAAPARTKNGDLRPVAGSLLAAAWPAAEPAFLTPPLTNLVAMPPRPQLIERLAAEATPEPIPEPIPDRSRTLQRIPHAIMPGATLPADPSQTQPRTFARPQGSFAARVFGNTLHAFLDLLANSPNPAAILPALPTWTPRISAVLRAGGLPTGQLPRQAAAVLRGLTHTLSDPDGLWLLSRHTAATSESSITTAESTLRLDRTFLAGPTPQSSGETHLWIVDYKTATHAREGLEDFLAQEKLTYRPQLEAYAQALAHRGLPIRLALYHPLLPALTWWEAPTPKVSP